VSQHGGKCWKQIATHLVGKTEVQCLHRWSKVLNPKLFKGPWSTEVRVAWMLQWEFVVDV
jgi:hypothetical protein